MDSFALLCNLYGDGPATVRRLREAGLGSLEAIDGAEPDRLAGLLRTSVRSAQRFQAEGRLLLERTAATVERAAPVPEEQGHADPLLRKVLETWRRMDAEDEGAADVAVAAKQSEAVEPSEPQGTSLVAEAADWLDAAARGGLEEAGILTLEDLSSCEPLAASQASGLGYTRVVRLQFLARRSLAALPAEPAAPLHGAEETLEHGVLRPSPPRVAPAPEQAPVPQIAPALPERRFSPAEGPPAARPEPLEPTVRERVDRRAPVDVPAPAGGDAVDSAGPFA